MKNPLHILCVEQRWPEGGQEVLAFSAVIPAWKHRPSGTFEVRYPFLQLMPGVCGF